MREMPSLVRAAGRESPHPWAVEAEGLVLAYGDHRALDGLTLNVPSGQLFGLLGPNGSGKSTLVLALAGLLQPQAGALRVLGRPPSPAVRAYMGFLFQGSSLDPFMTVEETLWLAGRLYGLGGRTLRRRLGELLEGFGLGERSRDAVRTLSGGLRRRLELARALLHRPRLLILDEPTTGLDPEARAALWQQLLAANAAGVTVLLVTHEVLDAERYCQRVAFLSQGRVVAEGSPQELKAGLRRDAVVVEWPACPPEVLAELSRWPEVGEATWAPPLLHLSVDRAADVVPRLFQMAGDGISSVHVHPATLEDAYFAIVGRPFRVEVGTP